VPTPLTREPTQPTPTAASDGRPEGATLAAWLCAATALSWLYRLRGEHLAWSIWSDRDLVRAAVPWSELPTSGAELSYGVGARVPGSALGVLFKLGQQVHDDPITVFRFMHLLDGLALLALYLGARRLFGPLAAAFAVATMAGSEVVSENLLRLWNPGFLPLFVTLGALAAARAAHDLDARWLAPALFTLAIGSQLHLSASLLATGLLLGVLITGPRDPWRWSLAGLALLLPYLPYLLHEATHGWPNQLALRQQPMVHAMRSTPPLTATALSDAWWFLRRLGPAGPPEALLHRLPALSAPLHVLAAALPVTGGLLVLAALRRPPEAPAQRRAALVLLVALALGWVTYLRDASVPLHDPWGTRYLQAFLPAWSLLVGAAGALVVQRSTHPRAARNSLGALLTVGLLLCTAATWDHSRADGSYRHLQRRLAALQQHTGWTTPELLGRLALASQEGGSWTWESGHGLTDQLRREQAPALPTQPPPCALWFRQGADPRPGWPDEQAVREVFRQQLPGLVVHDRVQSPDGPILLYRWHGPCHTSFANRYLLTETERALYTAWSELPRRTPTLLPAPDGVQRWAIRLGGEDPEPASPLDRAWSALVLGLDLQLSDRRLTATLHSNQLRGRAFNELWFANFTVGHPRLIARSADHDPIELPFAHDLVGRWGVLTPLVHTADLPAGDWQLSLHLEVLDLPNLPTGPYDEAPRHPVEIPLPHPLTVPP
jgi:hypothetical protein